MEIILLALALAASLVQDPTLTDLERTQLELLQTKTALAQALVALDACRGEIGKAHEMIGRLRAARSSEELTAAEADLKARIEARNPGWTWNPKTSVFTRK